MKQISELRQVNYNGRNIDYILTRKQVKNINLRVKWEGKVLVSANNQVSVAYIDNFVVSKGMFILRALEKYEEKRNDVDAPKQYISGESLLLLGKKYCLKVVEGNKEGVSLEGDFIFLVVKDKDNFKRKERLINLWLKEQQMEIFHQICREIYPMFQEFNVEYPIIKIRYMTSRWGSCQPTKGIITLNSKLIEVPRNYIEYVVLHEFAHFIHPNHSKNFYDLVERLMPDWKERKKGLNLFYKNA